eukprot:TRINITY_DN7045_c0_g1_i2.p2 TRINITY_DN7045_c0_g1~~TRINITY_DN7045_c0_g1_i2.p2  ORF type:complete len:307 (+),score=112.29 TRINITY_DN7045_c0_g1_i2:59-922(+)
MLSLRHSCGAECAVSLDGAQLVSWTDAGGCELLFMTSAADQGDGWVHGGVPVCWPRFGSAEAAEGPPATVHGFARSFRWSVGKIADADGGDRPVLELLLQSDDATRRLWPHDFALMYTLELFPSSLRMTLTAKNTGSAPFECTGALHTYYDVGDVTRTQVRGLRGCGYCNAVGKGKVTRYPADAEESRDGVTFASETDSVYGNASDVVEIVRADGGRLRLTKSGFPDWVLWNIGEEKAGGMKDLGPGEWRKYLCVEAARATAAVRLVPGASWSAAHTIESVGGQPKL